MKPLLKARLLLAAAATLSLASCVDPLIPRQVPFNEADFLWSKGHGTGSVEGQAYVFMNDNSARMVQQDSVGLTPVTPYSTESMKVRFEQSKNLGPDDPRYSLYCRVATTDDLGHFSFHNVPSGEYYVATSVEWSHWYWNDTDKVTVDESVPMYARVTIRNGETIKVTDWIYGKQKSS